MNAQPEIWSGDCGPIKVLLVEDNAGDVRLLREMLAEIKPVAFHLVWADRLSAGVERLAAGGIDVALVDLSLPDSQGLETLARIQAVAPHLPIIVFTGLDDEIVAIEALREGAQDYLVKGQVDASLLLRAARYAIERKQTQEEVRRSFQIQAVLNELLRISLEDISLEEMLRRFLDEIISIQWLAVESMGAIFLVEDTSETLVLKTERGLPKPLQSACARVPFGECLCGRAAASAQVVFADRVGEHQEKRYPSISPHGHCCVPVISAERVLGVISLYLKEGHRREQREEGFLHAVADVLAGAIERERAEEEKERLQEQLAQAQKMEAIGTLAAGIAHDFNNLLTAIMGNTDLLIENVSENDGLYENLKHVRDASSRAAELTRQLLFFSRRQTTAFTSRNVNKIIHDLSGMLERILREDIVVETDFDPGLWMVRADAGNLEQVIMNLAVNARDAMPKGGKLTIRTENVLVGQDYCRTHGEARPGRFVCVSIRDTGVGIDQEIIHRIFEPFFTTKGIGKGTGLGLAAAYGIVKKHDGWISVESRPGNGTVFTVYLPALPPRVKEQLEVPTSLSGLRGEEERVLVVEDEESVREFATRSLSQNGYTVFEAVNGREAFGIFEKEKRKFDLVFVDIVLPDDSGPELAALFSKLKPGIAVLLTSGYADEESDRRVIQEGMYPYLQKPYSLVDLLKSVKHVLSNRQEPS